MATSVRRLERSPGRRSKVVDSLDNLTVAFISHHRAMGHSESTIRHYQDSLNLLARCYKELAIDSISTTLTSHHMNLFAGWLRETPTRVWRGKRTRSIYGVHGALKDTKAFVRWLLLEEMIETVPKVPVPKLPQTLFPVLTEDELDRIFACSHLTGKSEITIRNRSLIAFMLDTGVRLSEAAGLKVPDVQIKEGAAKIRGKGNKERMVYFSESATDSMRLWLKIRGVEDGPFFWLASSGIRMLFKRIKDETGLPLFTAHQVRHTALTILVRQNVDLHTIKRLAGHASVTTTEAYLALAGEDLKEKHTSASPFDAVSKRTLQPIQQRRRLKSA